RAFRAAGYKVYFRYGADAVRTRMYRSWNELREGWTKNLALLFPHPVGRAMGMLAWWVVAWLTLPLLIAALALYGRVRRANFSFGTNLLAVVLGPPVFAYLLLRSSRAHARGEVSWKGRTYCEGVSRSAASSTGISRPSGTGRVSMLESRH
ncbi:MAG: hypothetical protein HY233_10990, partial [Acidobacteriales bacterium]|nr:hypothetical protein [Terriglobales bacterium]